VHAAAIRGGYTVADLEGVAEGPPVGAQPFSQFAWFILLGWTRGGSPGIFG
jgi:hypothetical protein